MLLAVDVGNTNIVMGLFNDGDSPVISWRLETSQRKSADEYGSTIAQMFKVDGYKISDVDSVIISSVVPTMAYTLQHISEKYFSCTPIFVDPSLNLGYKLFYDDPKSLGADRIVNASGALALFDGPVIIIDFGTATTFCGINELNEYLGGVIEPGIKISSDALFEKTSKLPKIEIQAPSKIIGTNTISCMQSGVVYSAVGATEYIVRRMKEELKEDAKEKGIDSPKEPLVIATGGLSSLVADNTDCIDVVDKLLTLKGLNVIHKLNM